MNRPSQQELRQWLTEHLADYLDLPTTNVDPAVSVVSYGADSMYALTLAADLADTFDLITDPGLAWEHPTINAISQYLTNLEAA